jgi:hypothetical protein
LPSILRANGEVGRAVPQPPAATITAATVAMAAQRRAVTMGRLGAGTAVVTKTPNQTRDLNSNPDRKPTEKRVTKFFLPSAPLLIAGPISAPYL